MPQKPARPCSWPGGCPNVAVVGGRCLQHARLIGVEQRPSAARRGYDRQWRKRRAEFVRENPRCVKCGAPTTDVDHILPLAEGGRDDEWNWQALCHACHSRKTAAENGGFGNRKCKANQNR